MQKIIPIIGDIWINGTGPVSSDTFSESLGQHQGLVVDRVAVRLLCHPKNDGTGPTGDEVAQAERMIAVQLYPDKQKNKPFILKGAPVADLKTDTLGPIPFAPFPQMDNNQFTVQFAPVSVNTYAMAAFSKSSKVQLIVTLYGVDKTQL